MNVLMQVWSFGEQSFTSSKTGRVYNRATIMGMVVDAKTKEQSPAIATLAFDADALSESPKRDSLVWLDCVEVSTKNAMLNLTFKTLAPCTDKGK